MVANYTYNTLFLGITALLLFFLSLYFIHQRQEFIENLFKQNLVIYGNINIVIRFIFYNMKYDYLRFLAFSLPLWHKRSVPFLLIFKRQHMFKTLLFSFVVN